MVGKLKKGGLWACLMAISLCIMVTPFSAVSETADEPVETADQSTTVTAGADPGVFEKLFENDALEMNFNRQTGSISIVEKDSGFAWRSTPENYDANEKLANSIKLTYDSQLLVEYADKSANVYELNSKVSCVNKDGLATKEIDGGILVTYTFVKEGFVIPVEYKLMKDGLQVNVRVNDIKETNAKYLLTGFSVLPFFGAGGTNDEGYMLVPDGSGAVIQYNNGKSNYGDYSQYLYGRDAAIAVKSKNANTLDAKLPVFGVKNGEAAMLAVVETGASRTIINAQGTGTRSAFNSVYPKFIYRDSAMASFNDKAWNEKEVRVFEKSPPTIEQYTIRYFFLPKAQANYTGMALRYQQYLLDETPLETTVSKGEYPLYTNFYGTIKSLYPILGFPIVREIPLTTYADAENILRQLEEAGVDDIVLKYSAWLKGGPDSSIPVDLKLSSVLGGKKAFTSLTNYMTESGIDSFFDVNLTDMYKSRSGYSQKWDCAKALNNSPAMQYRYLRSTYEPDERYNPLFLLNPLKVSAASKKIADKLSNYPISGAALDTLGKKLYSSFNQAGMDRESAEQLWVESIKELKESRGGLMLDEPNAYALPYASYLSSVPVESTGYAIEDYTVPFYQIAMHGVTSYSLPSINQTSDYKRSILKALETGSSLQFTWIAQNSSKLHDTPYDTLYSAEYTSWIDTAIQSYSEISDVMKSVADSKIVAHDILQKDVARTTYENGVTIVVNYTDDFVTVDGVQMAAASYKVGG